MAEGARAPFSIESALEKIVGGKSLARAEAEAAMEEILGGGAGDAQIAGLLTALRIKGETLDELVGFATVMRRHSAPVFATPRRHADEILVDTCGTGGNARGAFNISTAAAFVVAGAGVRVAKHGNRSISSRSGSADVLEALGVPADLPPTTAGRAIEEVGIGFLFAPAVHAATRHAMLARRALGFRTVFNLLGPLTNPAGVTAQVVGVFDHSFAELIARALGELGVRRAFVVRGADGIGEFSISGETAVAELRDGNVGRYSVVPEDFGLRRAPIDDIPSGDPQQNAQTIRRVLEGERGAPRDIVLVNAAAGLVAAGRAADWVAGVRLASDSIDSGAARGKLAALASFVRR